MKILVLGGDGFLGQHVCRMLRTTPQHEVIALSRRHGLDLRDFSAVAKCFTRLTPDVIYNCAAHVGGLHYVSSTAADVVHDNVVMALHMYRAAAMSCPTTHIVNPLSNCSYPGDQQLLSEREWLRGDVHTSVYPYGHAKRLLFVTATCYKEQYGIRSTHVLVPNAFGPGDRTDPNLVHALNGMIIRMLQAWKHQEPTFEVWGSGRPIREWVYIEDAAALLIAAQALPGDIHTPLNIAQQRGYAIRESVRMIARAIGYTGTITFNTQYADGAPQKVMHDEKFRQVFPNFMFMDHYAAICKTVDYYKSVLW